MSVPEPTLRRLPNYLYYLKNLKAYDRPYISAPHIAADMKLDATQVVKDLSYTTVGGKTKVGYSIDELIDALEDFLGFKRQNEAFLVGAGNLGSALIRYTGFKEHGFKIIAAFDVAPDKIGKTIEDGHVLHISKFYDLASRLHISIGIITTPGNVAQQIADLMVGWNIKAIWNFAPVNLKVPESVIVQDTSIYSGLAVLLQRLQNQTSKSNLITISE